MAPLSEQHPDPPAFLTTPPGDDRVLGPHEDAAVTAYIALLEDPAPSVRSLERAGITADVAASALQQLEQMGLARRLPTGAIDVPSPDTTIPALAAALEARARNSLVAMHGLTQLYHRSRTSQEHRLDLTVLSSFEDLVRARHQLAAAARREAIRACARSPEMDQALITQAGGINVGDTEAPRIASRLIVDLSLLEVPGAMGALQTIADHGIEVRLTQQVVCNLSVVDGALALIDLTNIEPTGYGSVVVRHAPIVQVIQQMLYKTFQSGLQLPRGAGDDARLLDERDTRILGLLAAGASDSTIARELSVSQRTVERRVRVVLDTLGAATRFQAGAIAARDGLI